MSDPDFNGPFRGLLVAVPVGLAMWVGLYFLASWILSLF